MRTLFPILFLSIVLFSSCQKEDEAVVLPAPGDSKSLVASMGTNYDNQIYVSLSRDTVYAANYRNFDLSFEASPSGRHIYLNGAKYMFLAHSGTTSISAADSAGADWKVDAEHLDGDSTAFGLWWQNNSVPPTGESEVMIIDRGIIDHSGSDRFRKIQVIEADDSHYKVRYSKLDNSGLNELIIPKDPAYSLMYFSFNNNGQLVQQAPPKNDWDFVFTKYTHVYFDEPLSSPYRFYPVTGGIVNMWDSVTGVMAELDSTPNYIPYEQVHSAEALNMNFSHRADIIGFDWKFYDFASSQYHIAPNLYFVLKDHQGFMYKLRMIDFYDHQGNKGTVTFEYQRL